MLMTAIRRRDELHLADVIEGVIAKALGTAIQILLQRQAIPQVPGKPVGFTIFIGQGLKTTVGIVGKLYVAAMGIDSLAYLTTTVMAVMSRMPGQVDVTIQQAARIVQVMFTAAVGQHPFEQPSLMVVRILHAFAEGIGDSLQMPAPVIAEAGRIP
ncbi:hypothetical protein D9M71_346480 [compost metagenome]